MAETDWEQMLRETESLRGKVSRGNRRNRWMVLATVVLLVAALATPVYRMANAASIQARCFAQEQSVEAEAKTFRDDHLDFPDSVTELASGKSLQCPGGGDYTWNPVLGTLTCSEHGHWGSSSN